MTRRARVLLVGDVLGSYRSQLLLKILLDNGHKVSLVGDRYFRLATDDSQTLFKSILVKLSLCFSVVLFTIELFIKAPFANVVYLLPMNHQLFFFALVAKIIFRKSLISDLYISLYDTGRDRGLYTNNKSVRARIDQTIDRWIIEKSDVIVHQSLYELKYIANLVNAKINHKKVMIFPLAVEPRSQASLEYRQQEELRICWWGTFIPLHGLDRIIQSMKILRQNGERVRLDLFGVPNVESLEYQKLLSEDPLKEYVSLHFDKTFANGHLEKHLTTACDLALGIFGGSSKAKNTLPNKIIDAFSMKLPVLTMSSSALSEFISPETDIFTCENSPTAIAEAIQWIINNPKERLSRAESGFERYLSTFTVERYGRNITDLIASISNTQ
jgi:glycosyltransferase involved in cell wall biosynthesis